jgi:hypothetical protein
MAIRSQPLKHESHPAKVLIGDERAVPLSLKPAGKIHEFSMRRRSCNPGPGTGAKIQ